MDRATPRSRASLLLVIPPGSAKRFKALHLGLNVVGLKVQVHPLLGDLHVVGALQQHPDLGVREPKAPVAVAAPLGERLFGGVEGGRPERNRGRGRRSRSRTGRRGCGRGSWALRVDEVEDNLVGLVLGAGHGAQPVTTGPS